MGRGCGWDGVWCVRVVLVWVNVVLCGHVWADGHVRCGVEADDVCGWGVGCVCWGVRVTVGMECEVGACVSGVVW